MDFGEGVVVAKVVKAFSLDPDVARHIDRFENGKKSDEVNWALRSYFFSRYGEQIKALQESRDRWKKSRDIWKQRCLSNRGVLHHLAELLRAIFVNFKLKLGR